MEFQGPCPYWWSIIVMDSQDNVDLGVICLGPFIAHTKAEDRESWECHLWDRQASWPLCTLVSSFEKKKEWILRHTFQSSYWACYIHWTNKCLMFLHIVCLLIFYMYSFSISLTAYAKTAFHARPEMFQSSLLWVNCNQDFYKKRHKQKKKKKRFSFRTFILWQWFQFI